MKTKQNKTKQNKTKQVCYKYAVFAMLMLATVSCQQSDLDAIGEQKLSTTKTVISIDGITCEDGVLHFPSTERYFEVAAELSASQSKLNEFEQRYSFKSLRTIVEEIQDEISDCQSNEMIESMVDFYSDKVKFEDGRVIPRVTAPRYSVVANTDGIFFIDGVKHLVTENEVEITMPAITKSDIQTTRTFNYIDNAPETKAVETQRYAEVQYQGGKNNKRKVFARVDIMRYVASQSNGDVSVEMTIRIHMSAQTKNVFGWNSYKTGFTLEEFHYDVQIPRGNTSDIRSNEKSVIVSNGDVADFMPEVELIKHKVYPEYFAQPKFPTHGFGCLQFRALSGGTSPCGAVYDVNRHLPIIAIPRPIPNCK